MILERCNFNYDIEYYDDKKNQMNNCVDLYREKASKLVSSHP